MNAARAAAQSIGTWALIVVSAIVAVVFFCVSVAALGSLALVATQTYAAGLYWFAHNVVIGTPLGAFRVAVALSLCQAVVCACAYAAGHPRLAFGLRNDDTNAFRYFLARDPIGARIWALVALLLTLYVLFTLSHDAALTIALLLSHLAWIKLIGLQMLDAFFVACIVPPPPPVVTQ